MGMSLTVTIISKALWKLQCTIKWNCLNYIINFFWRKAWNKGDKRVWQQAIFYSKFAFYHSDLKNKSAIWTSNIQQRKNVGSYSSLKKRKGPTWPRNFNKSQSCINLLKRVPPLKWMPHLKKHHKYICGKVL